MVDFTGTECRDSRRWDAAAAFTPNEKIEFAMFSPQATGG